MNQNQMPKLTYEEELDVLEAVWKIGKEKGLDLLRPEQIKKLVDAGRLSADRTTLIEDKSQQEDVSGEKKNADLMADVFMLALKKSIESHIIEDEHYCTPAEWDAKSLELKNAIIDTFFYLYIGAKEADMRSRMALLFAGGQQNG